MAMQFSTYLSVVRPLLAALLATTSLAFAPAAEVTVDFKTNVFAAGENGYHTFRIPTIVRGNDGRLFAIVEGRKKSKSDSGDIDLVMKHSDDNGRTWSRMTLIRDAGKKTAGNPSPVVDASTGRVCLLYCVNCNDVFSTYSDDGGATWSDHKLVSKDVLGPDIKRIYTGPVHGIQLTRGAHAGRLIVPGSFRSSLAWDCVYGNCVFRSDDGGENWSIGAVDPHQDDNDVHPSESVAVELIDGRILFNARNHFYDKELGDRPTRVITQSSDGGDSYDRPFAAYSEITTPVLQNSMVRLSAVGRGEGANIIAYSAPRNPPGRRNWRVNMTLYLSFDEGRTWNDGTLIHEGMAAYSDLVKTDRRRLGLIYEAGGESGHYGAIVFCGTSITKTPDPVVPTASREGDCRRKISRPGKKIRRLLRQRFPGGCKM